MTALGGVGDLSMLVLARDASLSERVDFFRLDATRRLDARRRVEMGQFLTPSAVARFMASMCEVRGEALSFLDAGAGVGSLSAAWVEELCKRPNPPRSLRVVAYEVEGVLLDYLAETFEACRAFCAQRDVEFVWEIRAEDFVSAGVGTLTSRLFSQPETFDCSILNPPYRKIHTESEERRLLRQMGLETSNIYAGFLAIVIRMLGAGGELVAITPRSFCNGPYFRPFRSLLLSESTLRRLHVFETRDRAFRDDDVLQENVILHVRRGVNASRSARVTISSSEGVEEESALALRDVPYDRAVQGAHDKDVFIHIVPDASGDHIAERVAKLKCTLADLGLTVSTGRVVDFRAKEFLRADAGSETVPLIYAVHFESGFVAWPKRTKKPNALIACEGSRDLLVPSGTYVLAKRFTTKEERRRVVAVVHDPERLPQATHLGFENHVNYFHRDGRGLPADLARGLAVFLNSTLVDTYFRQFNGHTQVNATDLRSLRYPTTIELERLGQRVGAEFPGQDEIDAWIEQEIAGMGGEAGSDPVQVAKRIAEATAVLKALGLPREQQNERSALALLALLDLRPDAPWSEAKSPLCGITQMMGFFEQHYGKKYAPNTRETVRRFTVHQFEQAALVVSNPDEPTRPTNSPKWVYQVEPAALQVLRAYATPEWDAKLRAYLASVETLAKKYAQAREVERIPVKIIGGKEISLSPGGQNELVRRILEDFCPIFTPGGRVVYVGDTGEKWAHFDADLLRTLDVNVEAHGKMPDVVVYHEKKKWLVLIEAVTSHGPVNPKRHEELKKLFACSTAGLVFVTAFMDRKSLMKYLGEISWETEVWVAESPTHLITSMASDSSDRIPRGRRSRARAHRMPNPSVS